MFAELSIAPFNSVCSASCIVKLFLGAYLQSVSLTELRAPWGQRAWQVLFPVGCDAQYTIGAQ